jgi:hypothetical protein
MAKSARDKLAAKARKMTSEADKAAWRAAWLRLQLPDGGDVETAREAMLRALVDGKSIAEAEQIALASVLPPCPVPLPTQK